MIICHRHRFIFLKSRKTASSSVEIALSRACEPGDVVTPLVEHLGEEELRRTEGGRGPMGFRKRIRDHRGWREWRRLVTRGERARRYQGLMPACDLKARLPADVWEGYTKISIERNPWDRALSRYSWNKYRWEREGKWTFSGLTDFLAWMEQEMPHQLSNWGTYAIGDAPAVDFMLFYENLADDMEVLRQRLGLDASLALPSKRAKGGFRSDRRHYSEVLSGEDRAIIERACSREIEYFGYRYDP